MVIYGNSNNTKLKIFKTMQSRKITVVETRNQKKSVIMSAATTLAELKQDFDANGIDYTDMAFYEGTSHTELKGDNAVLPHDVPYKGTITNELVFMLTTVNKKIKSGAMTRSELFYQIKSKGLQQAVKDAFGKNFTNCTTEQLMMVLAKKEQEDKVFYYKDVTAEPKKENPVKGATIYSGFDTLVGILQDKGVLHKEDVEEIMQVTYEKVPDNLEPLELKSCYSDADIKEMFEGMLN